METEQTYPVRTCAIRGCNDKVVAGDACVLHATPEQFRAAVRSRELVPTVLVRRMRADFADYER